MGRNSLAIERTIYAIHLIAQVNRRMCVGDFHRLRELQIGVRTILQYGTGEEPKVSLLDILPSSLDVLGLAHCYEKDYAAVIENLQTLLAHRERFRNIKRIQIKFPWFDPKAAPPCFKPVKEACGEMGITFSFINSGDSLEDIWGKLADHVYKSDWIGKAEPPGKSYFKVWFKTDMELLYLFWQYACSLVLIIGMLYKETAGWSSFESTGGVGP